MSYEKATFLIGKQIRDIKDNIRLFFRDLEKILKENKSFLDKSEAISQIEEKINKFSGIKKISSDVTKNIGQYNMNNLKEQINSKGKNIENIKKSEEFINQEQKKQELETKKQALEKEIYSLREIINFKSLANFSHSFEKEMSIVKQYKENFKQAFQKTKGVDLLSLLQESKLQNPEILSKIQDINEKETEINSTIIEKTEIEDIEKDIQKISSEIDLISSKKLIEEKRLEKLAGNSIKIINSIRGELAKINIRLD